jgi:hypothetical protein
MAARPTNVSSTWIRSERRSRRAPRSCPTQVRTSNTARLRIELEDRAAVGVGQAHRLRDDRRQHLVEVAARADGVADLPEARSSSTERARSRPRCSRAWKSWTFWIAIAPCAAKVVDEGDRLVVERLHLVAPQRDDAQDALVRRASARRAGCGCRRGRARWCHW